MASPFIASRDGHQFSPLASTTPPDASSAFHWLAVILNFLTGRQAWPDPSITPSPVMAMSSAPFAQMGERAFTRSPPS